MGYFRVERGTSLLIVHDFFYFLPSSALFSLNISKFSKVNSTMRICLLLFLFGERSRDLEDSFESALKKSSLFYPSLFSELSVTKRRISLEESGERIEAALSQSMHRFLDLECSTSTPLNISKISSTAAPFRAVMSTGGTKEDIILADIGREEDVLVMTTEAITPMGTEQSMIQRFPTILRMSDSPIEQVAEAVIHALVHLGCRKYSFVYDEEPEDELVNQRLENLISALQKYDDLYGVIGKWGRQIERYNLPVSLNDILNKSATALIQKMQTVCKVHVLALSPENVALLIRRAILAGLFTDTKQLFIILSTHSNDLAFRDQIKSAWTSTDSEKNSSFHEPNILVVSYGQSFSSRTTDLLRTSRLTRSQTSLYEAVLFLSKVVTQTESQEPLRLSATQLLNGLRNQTVFGIPGLTKPITINQAGVRVIAVNFQIYSQDSETFQTVMSYNAITKKMEFVSYSNATFSMLTQLGVHNSTGDDALDDWSVQQKGRTKAEPISVVLGVVVGMVTVAVALHLWRRIQKFTRISWAVYENEMQFVREHTVTIGKFVLPQMTGVRGATMLYDGRLLASCCSFPIYVTLEEVKKNSLAKLVLKLSRDLDHANISKFYGIMWTNTHPYFERSMIHVSEMTTKGFLRTIVDDDAFALNWDLRFCLMWDLYLGLRYIHSSKLRFHGCMTSLCCFVDERFTLKINGTGILPYFGTLMRGKVVALPDYENEVSVMMVNLWMAPEARADPRSSFSAAADTFSLGVMLYEMSTRNAPFNVNLNDLAAFTEFSHKMKAGTYVPSPSDLELDTVPSSIASLVLSCWAVNTEERPDLNSIFGALKKIYPQRSGMSFKSSIVDRLMHYSNELEEKVLEQTDNLRAEANRVDDLLRDLLPYDIARRLRCGETIELEECESATVLFTDVPVFSEIVGKVTPFQLFTMLEHMCRILDVVVAGFTVFKVETIRDSYMVVGGVPIHIGNRHAVEVANLALAMIKSVRTLPTVRAFHLEEWMHLEARAGIHSGPLIAGIAGTKLPHYTIFGDTVNTASRMETTGEASRVHISKATYELLKERNEFQLLSRGLISVKGKGEVETFWLNTRPTVDQLSIDDLDLNEQSLIPSSDPKSAIRNVVKNMMTGGRSSAYLVP